MSQGPSAIFQEFKSVKSYLMNIFFSLSYNLISNSLKYLNCYKLNYFSHPSNDTDIISGVCSLPSGTFVSYNIIHIQTAVFIGFIGLARKSFESICAVSLYLVLYRIHRYIK